MINTFNIKEKIFNIDGFKISNTHFKIGAKIHASEFFYAKRLFQNSYYTARIAILLAIQIKKELSDQNESLTLIGYEYYSELLLSLIKKFLSDFGYKDVNHFLVIDLDEKVKIHPPNFQLLDNAVIIVPIASTGSTAKKIEEYIKSINKVEKTRFFNKHFNVILANDTDDSFKDVNSHTSAQHSFIQLNVNWENPSNCKWCFNDSVSRPLFGTDKSSLTPTLIFDLPSGKIKNQVDVEDEKDNLSINFDDVIFDGALIYRKAVRNNEHFLFSTNTEILLVKNMDNILPWLSNIKKKLSISPSEKIVIISPCHYSNMSFINLINEQLFNSSATIIHYQTNVDYHYNFKLLNESYLNRKGNKVFFVDDSLISGNSFFSIYDLFRFTTGYDKDIRLAGAIFLSDKSSPDIHKRVYRASSESLYSFVNINLPLPPKILGKKPLEHEEKRYEELSKYLLHDVMKKGFADKAKDLSGIEVSSNPDTRNKIQNAKETEEKDKRHLRMFKATHKVYDYFGKNNHIDSISFEKFLLECGFDSGLMEDKMAMMKVLSQYPFLLYKEIRQKSFLWHKDWINGKIRYLNQISFDDLVFTYNDFKELKFLIRRAVFLGNYRITNTDFFESINKVFVAIERKYILDYDKLSKSEIDNLEDFQNFLLKQYAELIYNNQWCAYRILKGINEFSFSTPQAKQFVRMVKIELAIVLRDFYALFNNTEAHDLIIQVFKEENPDVSETSSKIGINVDTEAIKENLKNREILASNKFEICDSALSLKDHNDELLPQFLNFLWIKLFTNFDYTNKVSGSNLSDKTGYIFEKARRLFKNSNKIGTFFIVSDGVNNPHLVYDKDANNMTFVENIDYKTHKALIRFLKGEINKSGYETIKEFKRETENIWEDEYSLTKEKLELPFMRKNNWLILIRISDDDFSTLGLMGFYSKENHSEDLLAKQFLMLIREDLGLFIKRHHKNDEFSALREAETVKRFAYLAGHGRQMMQKLANYDTSTFGQVVDTMEKLQYLIATKSILKNRGNAKYIKEQSIDELLPKIFFKNLINTDTLKDVINIGNKIYSSKFIENVVEIETIKFKDKLDGIEFNFNPDIFIFICFELFVNAKKNRFHYLENFICDSCYDKKNLIDYDLDMNKEKLVFKIIGSGPYVPSWIRKRINEGLLIKEDDEISGINLINKVIKVFNNLNTILIESERICRKCNYSHNTVTLTLNSITSE